MRSAQASIVKLGVNHYKVFVDAGRDINTGKRVRPFEVVRGSRKEADRVKMTLLIKYSDAASVSENLTLKVFVASMYYPHIEATLRECTVIGYKAIIDRDILPHFGSKKLSELNTYILERYLNGFENSGAKLNVYKSLRQMFNKAVKWQMLVSNPMNNIDVSKTSHYEPVVLDTEQSIKMIEHFSGHFLEVAVLIAISCALGREEIAALDWEDLLEDCSVISINKSYTVMRGKALWDETKNESGVRMVSVPDFAARRLCKLRGDKTGAIFIGKDGKRINADSVSKCYTIHAKKLKDVPYTAFENLRHTSLTIAIENDVPLKMVSNRTGHCNSAITERYYLRPRKSIDDKAAKAMDKALTKNVPNLNHRTVFDWLRMESLMSVRS